MCIRDSARVEADALDDGAAVEALDLGVGVELVEVADAEGEICLLYTSVSYWYWEEMLHQTFDFFLGHARRLHDTINGGAN